LKNKLKIFEDGVYTCLGKVKKGRDCIINSIKSTSAGVDDSSIIIDLSSLNLFRLEGTTTNLV
jgi:hypothetical protein